MNGQNLIDEAERRFGDTTNAVISEAEWLAHVNAAYRLFLRASKWPNLVAETTATIASNGRSVAVPSAALQGGVVAVLVAGTPLEEQPEDLPIRTIRHWSERPTTPIYYELRGGRVTVLPSWAAGGSLTLVYLAAPTALTTGTSPVIPETYHDALVSGALARAHRDDENLELAQQYDAEFMAAAQAAMKDAEQESGEQK